MMAPSSTASCVVLTLSDLTARRPRQNRARVCAVCTVFRFGPEPERRSGAVKIALSDITWHGRRGRPRPRDALFYAIAFFVLGDSSTSVLSHNESYGWLGWVDLLLHFARFGLSCIFELQSENIERLEMAMSSPPVHTDTPHCVTDSLASDFRHE